MYDIAGITGARLQQGAIGCYRRCGFRDEGREREAAFVDGAGRNYLVMAVLETDRRR
jgi:RimJ/RimL family protein N-acetyltransferase